MMRKQGLAFCKCPIFNHEIDSTLMCRAGIGGYKRSPTGDVRNTHMLTQSEKSFHLRRGT